MARGQVEVEGEELGVLEGLEAVEGDRFLRVEIPGQLVVEEQTMAPGSGEVECHGGVRDAEGACDLSEAGPGDRESGDGPK
jgi:hypothetical protein